MSKNYDAEAIEGFIESMSQQIREAVGDEPFAIVGIRSRGDEVAERIHAKLGGEVPFGVLDISLYRDDYSHRRSNPILQGSEIDFDVDGAHVVLIDDVLFTGRTILAALSALSDYGRAASVRLGVLIDRGWREFPIDADFVGLELKTDRDERVDVSLKKCDGVDAVKVLATSADKS